MRDGGRSRPLRFLRAPRALTRRLQEFLRRTQDHVAVAIGAEEAADQCPSVRHADAHGLVEQRLQLLPGARGGRVLPFGVRVLAGRALRPRGLQFPAGPGTPTHPEAAGSCSPPPPPRTPEPPSWGPKTPPAPEPGLPR